MNNRYYSSNQNGRFWEALANVDAPQIEIAKENDNVVDFSMYKARRMLREIESEYFRY